MNENSQQPLENPPPLYTNIHHQRLSSSLDYLRQLNKESTLNSLNKEFSEVISEKSEINKDFSDEEFENSSPLYGDQPG